jgi:hypothetical protein
MNMDISKKIIFFLLLLLMASSVDAQVIYQNTAPKGDTWYKIKTRKQHVVTISARGSYAEYRGVVFLVSGIWNTAEVTTMAEFNYDHLTMDIKWGYIGSGFSRYLALKTSPISTTAVSGFTITDLQNHDSIIELEEVIDPNKVTPISQQSTFHIDEHSKRVGIGTTSPNHSLQIEGGSNESIVNLTTTGYANGLDVILGNDGHGAFWLRENSYIHFGTNDSERMRITSAGNVGINTTTPSHKLSVAGTINSEEIIVEENVGADFVFEASYDLPTLQDIEAFIEQNQHLPGIAPASQMIEEGVKVGELQMQLLQKIEELTLYVIEINKENKALREEVEALKKTSK